MPSSVIRLFVVAVLLLSTRGAGPHEDHDNTVRFLSGVFVPEEGVGPGVADYLAAQKRGTKAHVLVQFEEQPTRDMREQLRQSFGVRLLDSIPERAYFASLPAQRHLPRRMLRHGGQIRAVVLIRLEHKISPALTSSSGLPGTLRVLFFADVKERRARRIITRLGGTVVGTTLRSLLVDLPPTMLSALAAEDAVQWIAPPSPPGEEDNDGVRSPTGVNADYMVPVASLSLYTEPYSLSGAGVTVAQWEPRHASTGHVDLAGLVVVGEAGINLAFDRTLAHDSLVVADNLYDFGEAIYLDLDDDEFTSTGDIRYTTVGAFGPGSTVAPQDGDFGVPIHMFLPGEKFTDTLLVDGLFTEGEGIYRDFNRDFMVGDGDVRATPVTIVGPIEWVPPFPETGNSQWIYVGAQSPQDPISFGELPDFRFNVSASNNIAGKKLY